MVNSALVLRSITTVGNYDYVWDFIFYQNGAIEGKVQATGYTSSSFFHGNGLQYGNRVWEHTLGTIHTHFVNYRVDLDVGEVKNSLVAHDMAFEVAQAPWNPEQQIERPRLTEKALDTEDQAWGHQRGYRIQIISFAGDHIPEASSMERAISWARSDCSDGVAEYSAMPPASLTEAVLQGRSPWGGKGLVQPGALFTP
uniref:Amine oxidase n=1 Tax=Meleagris gallopavo TaxID=9103 RepID=A0A803YS14_MELGA